MGSYQTCNRDSQTLNLRAKGVKVPYLHCLCVKDMENEFKKQGKRGGARVGAGRKSIDAAPRTKAINIRVSEEDYAKIKSIDHFTEVFLQWLRGL